jgi:hypothetical protein
MRPVGFPTAFTLAAAFAGTPLPAQMDPGVPIGPSVSVPLPDARSASFATTVARADAEGRKWPSVSVPSTQPENSQARLLFGAAPRTCAGAVSIGPLRSGELLVDGEIGGSVAVKGCVRAAKGQVPTGAALSSNPCSSGSAIP